MSAPRPMCHGCIGADNKQVHALPLLDHGPTREGHQIHLAHSHPSLPLCNPRAWPLPALPLAIGRTFLFGTHIAGGHFLVTASSALAGLAIAPTPPPYRPEPAASHNAHDPFNQFPGKKSWTIFGCLLKIVNPLPHNCCPEDKPQ
jgi:hypothetical protein